MIQTLQSLRFIFVMMIFMSHFSYHEIQPFDAGGDCGVAFFFVLSGFVVSLGYGRQVREGTFSYGSFLLRRLKKLYPLHLLCLLFIFVVRHSALEWKTILNALLLQSWIPVPDYYFSYNGVSWFLSSILFCYLVFPWAYKHVTRAWLTAILGAYIVVVIMTPYDKVNAILYVNPLIRFVDFYLGMVLCRIYERGTFCQTGRWELLLIAAVIMTLAIYPLCDAKLRNAPLYWIVIIPLILTFARSQGFVSQLLQTKPMLFLGSLTMPLFMTHQILLGILPRKLPEMPTILMVAVCVLIALVVSWCIQIIFSRLFRL